MNKTNLACFPVLFFLVSRCLRPLVVGSAKCGICWRTYKAQESNPSQCSNPYLPANAQTQTIWPDCTNTDYSIRDPPPPPPHFLSSPLPSCPLLFWFFPLPSTLIPCFLPFPTPPLLSLNKFHHTAPWTGIHEYDFFFFSGCIRPTLPRNLEKTLTTRQSNTWRYTKYCQSVHALYI